MRKLILAIIAVILVDVVFVVYKSVDDRATLTSQDINLQRGDIDVAANSPNDQAEPPQTGDDLATASPSAELTEVTSESVEPARANYRHANKIHRFTTDRRSYAARRIKKDLPQPVRVDLQPITIFYAAREPYEFKADKEFASEVSVNRRSDLPILSMAAAPPRSENKSLMARTLPIIRKPYDWIKAIGSRLY